MTNRRRRTPINGDKRGRNEGRAIKSGAPVIAPPKLLEGQVRCPACRNAVTPTLKGRLRSHVDLFGYLCGNRIPDEPARRSPEDLPPVELPYSHRANGTCHECGRAVSGERKFCGLCLAGRL